MIRKSFMRIEVRTMNKNNKFPLFIGIGGVGKSRYKTFYNHRVSNDKNRPFIIVTEDEYKNKKHAEIIEIKKTK